MDIVVTFCSKKKDRSIGLLPAYLRYASPRIKKVMKIANTNNEPFYILSGRYGLIKHDKQIPYYDNYLSKDNIEDMVKLVLEQIVTYNISEIDLYTKPKTDDLLNYFEVIEKAAVLAKIGLNVVIIY